MVLCVSAHLGQVRWINSPAFTSQSSAELLLFKGFHFHESLPETCVRGGVGDGNHPFEYIHTYASPKRGPLSTHKYIYMYIYSIYSIYILYILTNSDKKFH